MLNLYALKQVGASLLMLVNLLLVIWAFLAYRQKQTLSEGFYRLQRLSPTIAFFLVVMGLFFVSQGRALPGRHLFYGIVVVVGIIGQLLLSRGTAWGQKYRAKPMIYGVLALFVLAGAARSWLSA
jgi:hypothetical protein